VKQTLILKGCVMKSYDELKAEMKQLLKILLPQIFKEFIQLNRGMADFIIHLAGVNRLKMISQFESSNYGLKKNY